MKTKKNLSQNNVFWKQFDLNKTNILLGQAIALYNFHVKFNEAKKNDEINNELIALPLPTYHHKNYQAHFKGAILENKNPFIIVQNKEFLEEILALNDDDSMLVNCDFNIIQVSYNEELEGTDEAFSFNILTKKEVKEALMREPSLDLRDF